MSTERTSQPSEAVARKILGDVAYEIATRPKGGYYASGGVYTWTVRPEVWTTVGEAFHRAFDLQQMNSIIITNNRIGGAYPYSGGYYGTTTV